MPLAYTFAIHSTKILEAPLKIRATQVQDFLLQNKACRG